MDHKLEINDELKMQEKIGGENATVKVPELKEYEVTADSGLFKNGKQYMKGEKILLVEQAAKGFLDNNEIK
jgi:hypothetical protein